MSSPTQRRPGVDARRDRSTAYLAGAAIVLSLWPIEAGLAGHWPLDTFCVRLWWSGVLLLCSRLVLRGQAVAGLVGSLSSIGSTAAMAVIAASTGGAEG